MCHLPRIERKLQWSQFQKVLILIPGNQFSNGTSYYTELNKNTKITVAGSEKNWIKFSNAVQSGNSCWP